MVTNISFVYKKGNQIKLIGFGEDPSAHQEVKKEGWVHVSTIDTSTFIQNLFNSVFSDKELRSKVESLAITD